MLADLPKANRADAACGIGFDGGHARVQAKRTGCSGYAYVIDYADAVGADDLDEPESPDIAPDGHYSVEVLLFVGGVMLSGALTSFVTGVTEPDVLTEAMRLLPAPDVQRLWEAGHAISMDEAVREALSNDQPANSGYTSG